MRIKAYMISCASREEQRRQTIANLRTSDWDEEPVVVLDRSTSPVPVQRIVETALALLQRADADGSPLILFLEDDLEFNRHLRHNLEAWPPLRRLQPGEHFFASLYNPGIAAYRSDAVDGYFIAVPAGVYGSQAFLLSRETVRYLVDHWHERREPIDHRMARLAARVSPLYYHGPSLIQHVGYQSVWGGWYHSARDFDANWRAESVVARFIEPVPSLDAHTQGQPSSQSTLL